MSQRNTVAKKKDKKKLIYIVIYFYMLLILLSLFTVASYTWFSLSRTPRVSNLNMYITTQSGLELSSDPSSEEWVLQLDFRDIVNETTPLRPVTWSQEKQCFIAAAYGTDGRLLGYNAWHPLTDERNANKDNIEGYYIKATFYARTGQNVDVTLSPAVEVNEGIDGSGTYVMGVPVWNPGHYETIEDENGEKQEVLVGLGHDNGGQGAENAIRLGFRITTVQENGVEVTGGDSEFFIFEPNCDLHADGSTGYVPTPSIDGTDTLIDPAHLIRQTASTWKDVEPVQNGKVEQTLGELIDTATLFPLETGDIVQIDLYIWLEGQDIDCTNRSSDAQIQANIQFAGPTEQQSGLRPIE